jgi:hypothetical protein
VFPKTATHLLVGSLQLNNSLPRPSKLLICDIQLLLQLIAFTHKGCILLLQHFQLPICDLQVLLRLCQLLPGTTQLLVAVRQLLLQLITFAHKGCILLLQLCQLINLLLLLILSALTPVIAVFTG